jgi:pimeloyl-ACP methyl ester carboxylesterase
MAEPVTKAKTLVTDDGVAIDTVHLPQDSDLAIVLGHGFTLSWQRPAVWQIAARLNQQAGVLSFDFRGHGRSGGLSTMGDKEIKDVDVVVRYARELGYQRVAAVGFSMGASIMLRYAGLVGGGLDAVVSVSSPGWWYFRGTERMRRVHFAVEHRLGRAVAKRLLNTRITPGSWDPVPVPPDQAAARIPGIPLLVVHGDQDPYFPVEHAQQIFRSAHDPKELWLLPGYGHAEAACSPELTDRIGAWVAEAAHAPAAETLARAAGAGVAAPPPTLTGTETAESAIERAETAVEAAGAAGRPGAGPPAGRPAGGPDRDAGSAGYQPEGSGMPSL